MCGDMETSMKRKIEVGIGGLSEALDRFERVWARAREGTARRADVRLTFESLPVLLANLTPARWTLLEQLRRLGPLSISELARQLGRHYKNVHTDVSRLIDLGLGERRADQRVAVAWDIVAAEMRLAA
jgi:predicted transcriptional regulator